MNVKQVIVIRKDLKMRRGKEISQGAHASIAWLTNRFGMPFHEPYCQADQYVMAGVSNAELAWINGDFTKICLQVNSEQELLDIHAAAQRKGLVSHLIQDKGLTEFGGIPTFTCVGIGPDEYSKLDDVVGHLKLY